MHDLRSLPKVRDSLSYLYLEHCKIEQDGHAIAAFDASGKTAIPCAALTLLMLGPGTNITHAAIKTLAENGCMVLWCGEEGLRYYAQGAGETRNANALLRQALLCSIPQLRLKVVRRMYEFRFKEGVPETMSLQQIRGREGVRVREAYAQASRDTGIPWKGRSYDRQDWKSADPINRALSSGNACLYGICHAAIVSMGLSPGLGFIHVGKQLSFVYDVGDLYKADTTIPLAFEIVGTSNDDVERRTRVACRDYFKKEKILLRIVDDINHMLDIGIEIPAELIEGIEQDPGAPTMLWDYLATFSEGGRNYGDDLPVNGDEENKEE